MSGGGAGDEKELGPLAGDVDGAEHHERDHEHHERDERRDENAGAGVSGDDAGHEGDGERDELQSVHVPQPIRLGQRVLFVGNTGTGKSEGLLALFAAHTGQRLLIDVQDHYTLGPIALAEEPAPLDGVDNPSEIDWRHRTIRYVPRRPGDRKEMDRLHAAIFKRGNLFVACDEAEDVAPSSGAGAPFYVKKCTKQGRKVRITYGAASQRPAGVDRSIINQAEHAFIFPMVDPDDLEALSYRVGLSVRELSEALNALEPFAYLRHTIGQRDERNEPFVIAMPPLPAEAIAATRRHVLNPQFSTRR